MLFRSGLIWHPSGPIVYRIVGIYIGGRAQACSHTADQSQRQGLLFEGSIVHALSFSDNQVVGIIATGALAGVLYLLVDDQGGDDEGNRTSELDYHQYLTGTDSRQPCIDLSFKHFNGSEGREIKRGPATGQKPRQEYITEHDQPKPAI